MKICKEHWDRLRQGVDDRGMGQLVGTAQSAHATMVQELEGAPLEAKTFDPLLQANNYIWGNGLQQVGLSAMNVDDTPGAPNDGHVCPLCEARKAFDMHNTPTGRCSEPACTIQVTPGEKPWDERVMFDQCLDPMRAYCVEQGLIAQPS